LTGLDDEFILEILSTMLPHELKIVKVGKWFEPSGSPFDEYKTTWRDFVLHVQLCQARKCECEPRFHCNEPLAPQGSFLQTQQP
jgi:hypothetical protein